MRKILIVFVILSSLYNCNKDDNLALEITKEEEESYDIANIKGLVNLKNINHSLNDIEIISFGERAKILNDGRFYIESNRNNKWEASPFTFKEEI